jgi:hypothetical protein
MKISLVVMPSPQCELGQARGGGNRLRVDAKLEQPRRFRAYGFIAVASSCPYMRKHPAGKSCQRLLTRTMPMRR